jgi:hypothetical protein
LPLAHLPIRPAIFIHGIGGSPSASRAAETSVTDCPVRQALHPCKIGNWLALHVEQCEFFCARITHDEGAKRRVSWWLNLTAATAIVFARALAWQADAAPWRRDRPNRGRIGQSGRRGRLLRLWSMSPGPVLGLRSARMLVPSVLGG